MRAAVAAAPSATHLRADLADQLITLEQFGQVIDLVAGWPDAERSHRAQMLLATCRLVPHEPQEDGLARVAADRAVGLAITRRQRAAALALRAKAERRLGDSATVRATLRAALVEDPTNIDACKRLAALLVAAGEETEVIALTDDLLGRGIAHPQVLNTRAVAQARLGLIDAARETIAFGRFARSIMLEPPPGFVDVATFNAAVAAELVAHPARRVDPAQALAILRASILGNTSRLRRSFIEPPGFPGTVDYPLEIYKGLILCPVRIHPGEMRIALQDPPLLLSRQTFVHRLVSSEYPVMCNLTILERLHDKGLRTAPLCHSTDRAEQDSRQGTAQDGTRRPHHRSATPGVATHLRRRPTDRPVCRYRQVRPAAR